MPWGGTGAFDFDFVFWTCCFGFSDLMKKRTDDFSGFREAMVCFFISFVFPVLASPPGG